MKTEGLPRGARVLCAVSGGADSVCLLHLLKTEGAEVYAAHYDHQLRGEESRRDAAFVRGLCADWAVPLLEGSGDVTAWAEEKRLSLETAARELRYAFLEDCADRIGADFIATAHTASDNAETLLLHLCRGSGARGLGGIPRQRDRILRPILHVTRAEVEAYLREHDLPHVEDSSNALDAAARNRIRHHAIPAMKSVNPSFEDAALRTARLLRADEAYLSSRAREELERIRTGDALSIPALLALPEALQLRVLQQMAGPGAELVHLDALLALCSSANASAELSLPGGKKAPSDPSGLRWQHNADHGAYRTEFRFDHKQSDGTNKAWNVEIMNQPEFERMSKTKRGQAPQYSNPDERKFTDKSGSTFYTFMTPISDEKKRM